AVNEHVRKRRSEPFRSDRHGALALTSRDLPLFWDGLLAARDAGADLGDWVDPQLEAILAFYRGSVGAGYRLLAPLRAYHSLARHVRLAQKPGQDRSGLVYGIQEISIADPLILSNTSNWVVAHLHSRGEVEGLARYYDFGDFAELTLRAEDVGFARLKTRSGR